jgi:osmoprotectant transport system permease protein
MSPDLISLGGVALTLASLAGLPFVVLRPNRILSGVPLSAASCSGALFYALLALLALLVFLALRKRDRPLWNAGAALTAELLLVLLFFTAGRAARALSAQADPVARVSLGGGVWLAVLGLYLILFACSRSLPSGLRMAVLLSGPAAILALLASGALNELSLLKELANRRETYLGELRRHLLLSLASAGAGAAVGIPLGLLMHRRPPSEKFVFFVVNLAQTIPPLSLLGLLILPLSALALRFPLAARLGVRGVGWTPAGIVLFLYALLPIAGNTLAGFRTVPPDAIEAARGMGMTAGQRFWRVELPLAFPVIVSGLRTALTQNIGNALLAGLIGGGGLGALIYLGLAQAAPDLILLGALSVAILALAADRGLEALVRALTPRGIRSGA